MISDHQWSIVFANSSDGTLSQPAIGEFKNGRGEFLDLEPFNGRTILARSVLSDITPRSYRLEQAFSDDGGKTWEVNWISVHTRVGASGGIERYEALDRWVVTFRPNGWRRLKTSTSHRSVPLWPQLREILERYLAQQPPSRLLFPSYRTGEEAMVTDFHKLLDAVAVRGGWKPGEIRSKMFRHTYCAARLQTLDQGAPVSVYTVAREMGHGGESMVRRVYGHLGRVRHRAEVVEYRAEQFATTLGDRLKELAVTTYVTTELDSQLDRVSDVAVTPRA